MAHIDGSFYAVKKGRIPGIYTSWETCAQQVHGFSGAIYKKFVNQDEAAQFVFSQVEATNSAASNNSANNITPSRRLAGLETGKWDTVVCEVNRAEEGNVGIGVWWGEEDPRNVSERCPGMDQLERGQLIAVARALESAGAEASSLLIKTTSLGCIDLVKHAVRLMKVQSPGEGVDLDNMPLSIYLPQLLDRVLQNRRVRFQHLSTTSLMDEFGVQEAGHLALLGTQRDRIEYIWSLKEHPDDTLESLQRGMESLEIEL